MLAVAGETQVSVAIVGGGPTGLTLAALLGRLGIRALVIEADPSTCDHPRAHVVNTRSMEIFRSLGVDAAIQEHALDMRRFGAIRFVTSVAGEQLACIHPADDPKLLAGILSASPIAGASCPQDRVEPAIAEKVKDLHFGHELIALEQDEGGVTATVAAAGGQERIRCDYLVGCDGAASRVRGLVDVAMQGPPALAHVVGIYVAADLSPWTQTNPAMLYWTIAAAPATFINMGAGRWTVQVAWGGERESLGAFTEERCREIVREAVGADVPIDLRSVKPWTLTAQVAETYRRGRVLLAGDACHRFPPTGGLGMNTGVQDAHNLAWKLAWVLRGDAGDALLDSYECERRPVGEGNGEFSLQNAMRMAPLVGPGAMEHARRLSAGEVSLLELGRELQAALEKERAHFGGLGRDLGVCYEEGALEPDGSALPVPEDPDRDYMPCARPGSRAPHAWIEHRGQTRSTLDFFDDRFTLLTPADHTAAWRAAELPVRVLGIGSDLTGDTEALLGLYGIEDGAVLVRPDGHIAWRTRRAPADPAGVLRRLLDRWLGVA